MFRLPAAIVMITVWCYWLSVGVMVLRSRLKFQTESGAVPRTGLERWLWLIWVPTVIGWLVLPGIGYYTSLSLFRVPQWAIDHPHALLDWLAVMAAVLAYVLTIPCWLTLGSNWSLAIVPGKESHLVTRGFYTRIRHPIYSLGMVLMAATIIVAPSAAMLIAGSTHLTLVFMKSANEERFLKHEHGQAYLEYCRRTSRFFPWPTKIYGESTTL